jgi:hypothetical protein
MRTDIDIDAARVMDIVSYGGIMIEDTEVGRITYQEMQLSIHHAPLEATQLPYMNIVRTNSPNLGIYSWQMCLPDLDIPVPKGDLRKDKPVNSLLGLSGKQAACCHMLIAFLKEMLRQEYRMSNLQVQEVQVGMSGQHEIHIPEEPAVPEKGGKKKRT